MSNNMGTPITVWDNASKLTIKNATLYALSIINHKTCLHKLSNNIPSMKYEGNKR